MAVWISDAEQRLAFLNPEAEELLGRPLGDCAGEPCWRAVACQDAAGKPFCGRKCSLGEFARGDQVLRPVRVRVPGAGGTARWLQLLIIPIEGPDGTWPWLVHCAQEVGRSQRIESYVECVAARNRAERWPGAGGHWRRLTAREQEVLAHLARDLGIDGTAIALGIQRVTVRNHVQHILSKLAVHSIHEAVATWLLEGPAEGAGRG